MPIGEDYFADGVVEDIITALSRVPRLLVIARNSSFTYKNRAVDVREVGRELGVRYVLEGSMRRAGERLRITGQLIDAGSGTHLWADRYEGRLDDVFDLQDRITAVSAIMPRLIRARAPGSAVAFLAGESEEASTRSTARSGSTRTARSPTRMPAGCAAISDARARRSPTSSGCWRSPRSKSRCSASTPVSPSRTALEPEAVGWARRAIGIRISLPLAAALAHLGRIDEARAVAQRLLADAGVPSKGSCSGNPASLRSSSKMRKAGLPA